MNISKRIENDEQYDKARLWCLEAAERLEDPLLDKESWEKTNRVYDATQRLMGEYNRGCMAQDMPYLKALYDETGTTYQTFEEEPQ